MACIILRNSATGEITRRIPEQENYRKLPGEVFKGEVDWHCAGAVTNVTLDAKQQLLAELDEELGRQGAGEWIKKFASPVAKIIGKKNCMSCEVRRVIADAYGKLKAKHGQVKALSIIADLAKRSFTDSEEEKVKILEELKCYLSD